MGFHVPEDGVLHSHRRENLISYTIIRSFRKNWLHEASMFLCACTSVLTQNCKDSTRQEEIQNDPNEGLQSLPPSPTIIARELQLSLPEACLMYVTRPK
jgi:hypothetical protein